MEKPSQNIQDSFLNAARKERLSITIYLLGGVKLTGRIRSFDKYCLVLETGSMEQMIFKHAISTMVLQRERHAPMARSREEAIPVAPAPAPAAAEAS
ncbi:MAG: RNA chaperone Hfq [Terriglobales bacterium]